MTPFSFKQSSNAQQSEIGQESQSNLNGNSYSPKANGLLHGQTYSDIMKQRWLKANKMIPEVDQNDIIDEHPFFNGGKIVKSSLKH